MALQHTYSSCFRLPNALRTPPTTLSAYVGRRLVFRNPHWVNSGWARAFEAHRSSAVRMCNHSATIFGFGFARIEGAQNERFITVAPMAYMVCAYGARLINCRASIWLFQHTLLCVLLWYGSMQWQRDVMRHSFAVCSAWSQEVTRLFIDFCAPTVCSLTPTYGNWCSVRGSNRHLCREIMVRTCEGDCVGFCWRSLCVQCAGWAADWVGLSIILAYFFWQWNQEVANGQSCKWVKIFKTMNVSYSSLTHNSVSILQHKNADNYNKI